MRRPFQHCAPLRHQRVAGSNRGADLRHQQAALARHGKNLSQRDFQILLNVVAQRFKWGDVEDFGSVGQIAGEGFSDQPIDAGQKCGQSFARIRWAQKLESCARRECAAIPVPAVQWACRTYARTTPPRADEPNSGRKEGTASKYCNPENLSFAKRSPSVAQQTAPVLYRHRCLTRC